MTQSFISALNDQRHKFSGVFPYFILSPKSAINDTRPRLSSFSLSLYPTFVVHDLVEHVLCHGLRQLLGLLLLFLRVVGAHPVVGQNVIVTFNRNEGGREAQIISNGRKDSLKRAQN